MRILVTGSAGTIGQALVPRLKEAGHEVKTFDVHDDCLQNITNQASVLRGFIPFHPQLCIHMAAQPGRLVCEQYPEIALRSNIQGTYNVAERCAELGVPLINFSTSEVYGHNSVYGQPDIFEQNGVYGISKLAAEGLVKHLVDFRSLKAITVRPFMVYGPPEVADGEFRSAISNFIDTALREDTMTVHDGCIRSWCYIDDFIDGLMLLLDYEPDGYEVFDIGTDEYHTMEECAKTVIETVGAGHYVMLPVPEHLVSPVKKVDLSKIRALGHAPKVTLDEGIKRTYEWMSR